MTRARSRRWARARARWGRSSAAGPWAPAASGPASTTTRTAPSRCSRPPAPRPSSTSSSTLSRTAPSPAVSGEATGGGCIPSSAGGRGGGAAPGVLPARPGRHGSPLLGAHARKCRCQVCVCRRAPPSASPCARPSQRFTSTTSSKTTGPTRPSSSESKDAGRAPLSCLHAAPGRHTAQHVPPPSTRRQSPPWNTNNGHAVAVVGYNDSAPIPYWCGRPGLTCGVGGCHAPNVACAVT